MSQRRDAILRFSSAVPPREEGRNVQSACSGKVLCDHMSEKLENFQVFFNMFYATSMCSINMGDNRGLDSSKF